MDCTYALAVVMMVMAETPLGMSHSAKITRDGAVAAPSVESANAMHPANRNRSLARARLAASSAPVTVPTASIELSTPNSCEPRPNSEPAMAARYTAKFIPNVPIMKIVAITATKSGRCTTYAMPSRI